MPGKKKTLTDLEVQGKRVLMRVDFNVPLLDGRVRDDSRIRAALPSIKDLTGRGARLILITHLGRPRGTVREELRLDPVAEALSRLLQRPVRKLDMVVGPEVERTVDELEAGEILLLENLRFIEGEEQNDPVFARSLASLADYFVNDAFGTAHRAHASTVGVATIIPAVAGFLMEREINELTRVLEAPARPFAAVLGGAKVSDKINVIRRFMGLADNLLLGGGMANTFLVARGYNLQTSFYESAQVDEAERLLAESETCSARVLLPDDLVVTTSLDSGSPYEVVAPDRIPAGYMAVDIGPRTAEQFGRILAEAGTVVWNGPLGVFESPPFDRGTGMVASSLADSEAYAVAGGGDLVAALESLNLTEKFAFISTGGGATLEFWEGRKLPGIAALLDA